MIIEFMQSGGYAGNMRGNTIKINTDTLDAITQQEIIALINNANFFNLSDSPLPKRGADYFNYTITVKNHENMGSHTIKINKITMDSKLEPLFNYLNKQLKSKSMASKLSK